MQKLKRPLAAARFYEECLSVKPGFAEALLNLGHVLNDLGKREEAAARWKDALEAKPELALGYFSGK